MCGIAGVWDPGGTLSPADGDFSRLVTSMANIMEHRGPDGSGKWCDPASRVGFAHRRLAILDLSEAGRQPMTSADQRWVVTFNGEIYNHADVRQQLALSGANFRSTSDTEVLVECISTHGIASTLRQLHGMFAFAAWDRLDRRLYLARDRLGEKPLYVTVHNGWLAFASESRAFHCIDAWPRPINRQALSDVLSYGYIRDNASIFANTVSVPPGQYVSLRASDLVTHGLNSIGARATRYWTLPSPVPLPKPTESETVDELEELLRKTIAEQTIADVPVGAFLSGGLDSSVVVALAARGRTSPLKTFTVEFDSASHNEGPWARRIAEYLGTEHHSIQLSEKDILDSLPLMGNVYAEPFADPSQVPTFLISQFARQTVKVCLTGDGGDEVFCGYNRYLHFRRLNALATNCPIRLRLLLARLATVLPPASIDRAVTTIRHALSNTSPLQSVGARVQKLQSFLLANDLRGRYDSLLRTTATASLLSEALPDLPHFDSAPADQFRDVEDTLMRIDLVDYLPNDNLVKLDRASMAVGLECRAPFLHHHVVQAALSLPLHNRIRNNKGKWPLRQILARHLPPEFFERPKAGFSVPIAAWLRGPLSTWLRDTLARDQSVGPVS